MDIPNLSQNEAYIQPSLSKKVIIVVIILSIFTGFIVTKIFPLSTATNNNLSNTDNNPISSDTLETSSDVEVNQIYGNTQAIFKDTAMGTIEKGNINGEGTHILVRDGGIDQRASLTSSVVDLDLFVGRKVEVKGQTHASTKTGWLLDVGWLKVLQ